jgi:hypothetical protein
MKQYLYVKQTLIILSIVLLSCLFCSCKTDSNESDNSNNNNTKTYTLEERLVSHKYPKLANQLQNYLAEVPVISNAYFWDMVIVDVELVANNPEYLGATGKMRTKNSYLVILGYFSWIDVIPENTSTINGGFREGIKDGWYMKDIKGERYKLFNTGTNWTEMINQTINDVSMYTVNYLNENVISKGILDGIFFDWINTDWIWLNYRDDTPSDKPDIDNDGYEESDIKLNNAMLKATKSLLENSKEKFPSGTLIMGNGGWITGTKNDMYLNGIMIENFIGGESVSNESFGWGAVMRSYYYHTSGCKNPNISMLMANGKKGDYKFMRFALASALMFDGYFCYTNENDAYYSDWWYDEYSVDVNTGNSEKNLKYKGYLGSPINKAFNVNNTDQKLSNILKNNYLEAENIVWRRDFEHGIVLVNPTKNSQNIKLSKTYKKINGLYDTAINDGSEINEITLKSKTGIILLKK